jgi:uridine kinase
MQDTYYIIGIAGGSGSGKSTFVQNLKQKFTSEEVCIVTLDNYYIPRDEQVTDENGYKNFDLPGSIDSLALLDDLKKLKQGQEIEQIEYVFNNEKAVATNITIKPAPVIIIEGLFIYHYQELRSIFDLKLFIHAKENLKLIRRIKRDQKCRNYPLEDVIYRYENHVIPSFEKYIEIYKEECDLIVNNNKSFDKGLEVVELFIEGFLHRAKKES